MVRKFIQQVVENKKSRELDDLADLNDYLKKNHLCVLKNRFDTKSLKKIARLARNKSHHPHKERHLLELISARILNPKYRAYQNSYRYRQLHIFKSFNKIIDFAILSFFRKNWVCSYLTLVQIVQEILRKWLISINEGQGNYKVLFAKIKEKIVLTKEELAELYEESYNLASPGIVKIETVLKTSEGDDYATLKYYSSLYKFLLEVVRDIFEGRFLSADILTNRHIRGHLRKNPRHFCSDVNAIRLLIALDAIAELYLWKNKTDYLLLKNDSDNKAGSQIFKKYYKFYSSSFRKHSKAKTPEEVLLRDFYS